MYIDERRSSPTTFLLAERARIDAAIANAPARAHGSLKAARLLLTDIIDSNVEDAIIDSVAVEQSLEAEHDRLKFEYVTVSALEGRPSRSDLYWMEAYLNFIS